MSKTIKALTGFLFLATVYNPVFAETEKTQIEKDLSASGVKVGVAFDQGFGVTAQFDNRINAFIGNDGVSADYILKQGPLDADVSVNWYVGIGSAINWDDHDSNNSNDNSYSVRVPLGASIPFAKNWDIYGQVAPDFALKDRHNSSDNDFEFGVDVALGVRYGF
jgi:hypothetical protein